jgi:proline-specific peptidase
MISERSRLVPVRDTQLFVVERGAPHGFPLLVLHGGPGLDHHEFADYLDALTEDGRYRLVLVDQRAQGRSDRSAPTATWTVQEMAADISALAASLGEERYAVLGHSFGAFVSLQHAVDEPGAAVATIVSSGVPAMHWLETVERNLAEFEPVELREQVAASWAREATVDTVQDAKELIADQMPFHFADPRDPRIADYLERVADGVEAPDVLRHFATAESGGIDVEHRLGEVGHPMLVLAGRQDRTCAVEASAAMAAKAPGAELVVFEHSGHMTFVEENESYVGAVREFLDRTTS